MTCSDSGWLQPSYLNPTSSWLNLTNSTNKHYPISGRVRQVIPVAIQGKENCRLTMPLFQNPDGRPVIPKTATTLEARCVRNNPNHDVVSNLEPSSFGFTDHLTDESPKER